MDDTRIILDAVNALKKHVDLRIDDLLARIPTFTFEDSTYCIQDGYRHRAEPLYFDDTGNDDDWQREVYLFAQTIMTDLKLTTVYDLGCGSAFKLIKFLGDFDTVGADVPATVNFLQNKYPNRKWTISDFSGRIPARPDLLICADVIEHVPDPHELIRYVLAMQPTFALFSTPDRDLVYPEESPHRLGPPANLSHLREWNSSEFCSYIGRYFKILKHEISNRQQATQMVFCTPRA